MKVSTNKKKMRGYREFLYILPFIILVAIFAYYPLYGWAYAFFDYKPPRPLSMDDFVGLKWFRYLVDNPVRIKQTLMVLRNTFAMSGLTILFSWLPMIFAVRVLDGQRSCISPQSPELMQNYMRQQKWTGQQECS